MITPPRTARRPSSFCGTALDRSLAQTAATSLESIPLPSIAGYVHTIREVITPAEASAIITTAESLGFSPALLNIGGGQQIAAPEIRKSDRVIVDSIPFANELFARLRAVLPPEMDGRPIAGLNERLRILKYTDADYFRAHQDGHFVALDGKSISLLTVLLYLNADYEGARTTFFNAVDGSLGEGVEVVPETGMAAVQDQVIWHSVPPLISGVKYAIRTEVMYAMDD